MTPAPGAPRLQAGDHQRPMRHVGIVAGVLHDANPRIAVAGFLQRQRESRPLPAGQDDLHGVGEGAAVSAA